MLVTTRRGIQYPNTDRSDRADIALHLSYLALPLDADVIFNQGTDAARLAAAHQAGGGRFWWTTDTKLLWWDDGAAWQTVSTTFLVYNTQAANYTPNLNDAGKVVEMNSGSANSFTVPPNSAVPFPIGIRIDIAQLGAGLTTIAASAGVTLRSYNNALKLAGQYAMASIQKRGTDDWWVAGNIIP